MKNYADVSSRRATGSQPVGNATASRSIRGISSIISALSRKDESGETLGEALLAGFGIFVLFPAAYFGLLAIYVGYLR